MSDSTAPFSVAATGQFERDGNDGVWSTFYLAVGTPPQSFRVGVSTTSTISWVIAEQGCDSSAISNCAELRAGNSLDGGRPQLFSRNNSTTWEDLGLYTLLPFSDAIDFTLGYGNDSQANGEFGFDTVTLGKTSTISIGNALMASIASSFYWMGEIGLGIGNTTFSNGGKTGVSLIDSLINSSRISSRSWAYSAGAVYSKARGFFLLPQMRNVAANSTIGQNYPGSLVLGGLDTTRLAEPLVRQTHQPIRTGVR